MEGGQMMQKVMVIHDVSKQSCWSAIRWVVNEGLCLNPGDELILLGVVHHLNDPATLDFLAAAKQLGYETTMTISNDMREEEMDHGDKEQNRPCTYAEMLALSKQCQLQKVKLWVDVRVGVSRKVVAVESAKDLEATWIVLDREMKKERKYFMKKLSCGIWKVKSDNTAEQVRAPPLPTQKTSPTTAAAAPTTTSAAAQMSYNEMIPSSRGKLSSSSRQKSSLNDPSKPVATASISSSVDSKKDGSENNNNKVEEMEENVEETTLLFSNSVCSLCQNKRPAAKPGGGKKDFTYAELEEATGGFLGENYLSEGGFGCVYKGKLKNGVKIAVKQHKNMMSLQGEREFKSEVDVLSRATHENLVMLLGSCSEGTHRLLVYEYVCNGSLNEHLSSDAMIPLNWEQRLKIAVGAAKGLEYLHAQKIIHRDIRPNNILITHDHQSLLGDFGLARARSNNDESNNNEFSNESVVGALGYIAPEYAETGKFSTKTDVYSFGLVLLQLITGLNNTDERLKGRSLVEWAVPVLEQKNYPRLIDTRIVDSHDVHQLFGMVQLVEECLRKDPNKRPPMKCVVDALSDIIEGQAIRQCSQQSKTYSFSNALIDGIQPQKDNNKVKDNNQNLINNNKCKSEKAASTLVKESERKQCSERGIEVRRVGFKSSGTIKSMCRKKLNYHDLYPPKCFVESESGGALELGIQPSRNNNVLYHKEA
ncbi:PREDICTED: proline-rich receptor-like protein kinase PERK3 [Ipomoea nil]|uniref:proline-rich receptor-like protein kinase PERK3 n=1 Tax=Ipomoea nil TaxID=35883 RepID=UPI000901C397|nr:PREDICTED: proline-rich receptor-like protein kinase PERK3 [Ipomoea nil]